MGLPATLPPSADLPVPATPSGQTTSGSGSPAANVPDTPFAQVLDRHQAPAGGPRDERSSGEHPGGTRPRNTHVADPGRTPAARPTPPAGPDPAAPAESAPVAGPAGTAAADGGAARATVTRESATTGVVPTAASDGPASADGPGATAGRPSADATATDSTDTTDTSDSTDATGTTDTTSARPGSLGPASGRVAPGADPVAAPAGVDRATGAAAPAGTPADGRPVDPAPTGAAAGTGAVDGTGAAPGTGGTPSGQILRIAGDQLVGPAPVPPAPTVPVAPPVASAATAATAAPDLQALSASFSRVLVQGDGDYSVSVSMHPPELGEVRALLSLRGDVLQVVLTAHQEVGHGALAAVLPELRDQLSTGGLHVDVSLGQPDAQAGGDRGSAGRPTDPGRDRTDPDPAPTPTAPAPTPVDADARIHLVL